MKRRDALKSTTLLIGGTFLASTGIFAACRPGERQERRQALSVDDENLIEEIADTLLPTTTSSPGARAAGAGAAINLLLTDCYDREAQGRAVHGLAELRERSEARFGRPFASLGVAQREELLREIDAESRERPDHWFRLVRELSLRAYFSSEVGMTKALRYVLVPGRWTGCVPLAPGQPAWA